MKKNWIWFLFLILILAVLLIKVSPYREYQYASTTGDFSPVLDPENIFRHNLSVFRLSINNGYADNTANIISHVSPYFFYELVLHKLGVSQLVRTYLFLLLISFWGSFCLYRYLLYKLTSPSVSRMRLSPFFMAFSLTLLTTIHPDTFFFFSYLPLSLWYSFFLKK